MKNALDFLSTFGVSCQCEGASPLRLGSPGRSVAPDIEPACPKKKENWVAEVREAVELRLRYPAPNGWKSHSEVPEMPHQLVFQAPRGSGSCTCEVVVLTSLQAEDLFTSPDC
jgi:hypothetical protein